VAASRRRGTALAAAAAALTGSTSPVLGPGGSAAAGSGPGAAAAMMAGPNGMPLSPMLSPPVGGAGPNGPSPLLFASLLPRRAPPALIAAAGAAGAAAAAAGAAAERAATAAGQAAERAATAAGHAVTTVKNVLTGQTPVGLSLLHGPSTNTTNNNANHSNAGANNGGVGFGNSNAGSSGATGATFGLTFSFADGQRSSQALRNQVHIHDITSLVLRQNNCVLLIVFMDQSDLYRINLPHVYSSLFFCFETCRASCLPAAVSAC